MQIYEKVSHSLFLLSLSGWDYRQYDIEAATFLDVAVLRCLFVSHWLEEGVYWSLHYLYNR